MGASMDGNTLYTEQFYYQAKHFFVFRRIIYCSMCRLIRQRINKRESKIENDLGQMDQILKISKVQYHIYLSRVARLAYWQAHYIWSILIRVKDLNFEQIGSSPPLIYIH